MNPVEKYSGVIHQDSIPEMDAFVLDMHTKNGLLDECLAGGQTLEEAEQAILSICQHMQGTPRPKGVILAGNTVHFDLNFIREHMPILASCLSHRVFDVSTLKNAERVWGNRKFPKTNAHRALPDVLESLAEAKAFRDQVYP